ncbi:hypothetical protein, partial [Psychrobacter sp. 2Y4]|uniref:hypothetical protein n=1 Tax=Psychrobacter sp. 2Y4 TaxID=3453578 RepID=UPI003F44A236
DGLDQSSKLLVSSAFPLDWVALYALWVGGQGVYEINFICSKTYPMSSGIITITPLLAYL